MQEALTQELRLIWKAHQRAGLSGKMCLYSMAQARPWPSQTPGLTFWFGPDETEKAVEFFITHYKNGVFPCTPLLLNPFVHKQVGDQYEVIGSGITWATALTVNPLAGDKLERLNSTHAAASYVARGDNKQAGLKIVGFSRTPLAKGADNAAEGGRSLYDLADISGEDFWPYYLLSGVTYLSSVGGYTTAPLASLFADARLAQTVDDGVLNDILEKHTVDVKTLADAALCWERYDRHPTLYRRFGNNVAKLDENLKFYYYCARDFGLFDSIGPDSVKSKSESEQGTNGFDFLVHGLIPRGSIVLLAGTGGTGKSSIAHKLCCMAATDWRDDEQPLWLGQPLNKPRSKGICVYFSGEDGPAIIQARNEIFDPEHRAQRLMFQRNHFVDGKGEDIDFASFLNRLRNMPEVPLLVVDPARKYLTGDEDDAAVVSHFFEAIEKFAHERNTAVIVVHHLSKGAKPTSAREVLDELRGSQVFIDRPRVVIGMFREGPKTVVGLAKCNIPPSLGMVTEERVFAHDPKTLNLTQLPGKAGVRDPYYVAPDEEDA